MQENIGNTPPDKLSQYYAHLKATKVIPSNVTEKDFRSRMSTEESARAFHTALVTDGVASEKDFNKWAGGNLGIHSQRAAATSATPTEEPIAKAPPIVAPTAQAAPSGKYNSALSYMPLEGLTPPASTDRSIVDDLNVQAAVVERKKQKAAEYATGDAPSPTLPEAKGGHTSQELNAGIKTGKFESKPLSTQSVIGSGLGLLMPNTVSLLSEALKPSIKGQWTENEYDDAKRAFEEVLSGTKGYVDQNLVLLKQKGYDMDRLGELTRRADELAAIVRQNEKTNPKAAQAALDEFNNQIKPTVEKITSDPLYIQTEKAYRRLMKDAAAYESIDKDERAVVALEIKRQKREAQKQADAFEVNHPFLSVPVSFGKGFVGMSDKIFTFAKSAPFMAADIAGADTGIAYRMNRELGQRQDISIPNSSKTSRGFTYKFIKTDGSDNRYVVKDGAIIGVTDANGYDTTVDKKTYEAVQADFTANPKKYKQEQASSFSAMLYQGVRTTGEIAAQVAIGRGMNSLIKAEAALAATATAEATPVNAISRFANTLGSESVKSSMVRYGLNAAIMAPDMYADGIAMFGSDAKGQRLAALYALTTATATSAVTSNFGIEDALISGKIGGYAINRQTLTALKGLPIQQRMKIAGAMHFSNIVGENGEELLFEPTVEAAMKGVFGQPSEYMSVDEFINTATTTTAATLLAGSVSMRSNVNRQYDQMKAFSFEHIGKNYEQSLQALQELSAKGLLRSDGVAAYASNEDRLKIAESYAAHASNVESLIKEHEEFLSEEEIDVIREFGYRAGELIYKTPLGYRNNAEHIAANRTREERDAIYEKVATIIDGAKKRKDKSVETGFTIEDAEAATATTDIPTVEFDTETPQTHLHKGFDYLGGFSIGGLNVEAHENELDFVIAARAGEDFSPEVIAHLTANGGVMNAAGDAMLFEKKKNTAEQISKIVASYRENATKELPEGQSPNQLPEGRTAPITASTATPADATTPASTPTSTPTQQPQAAGEATPIAAEAPIAAPPVGIDYSDVDVEWESISTFKIKSKSGQPLPRQILALARGAGIETPVGSTEISLPSSLYGIASSFGEGLPKIPNAPASTQPVVNPDGSKIFGRVGFMNKLIKVGRASSIITADGKKVQGKYVLVDVRDGVASHTTSLAQNPLFPTAEDGQTANSRSYPRGGQEATQVLVRAAKFDGQAVQDLPVIDKNGVVISGNGRWMSREIAMNQGTDGEYLAFAAEQAEMYGFTADDINNNEGVTIAFMPDEDIPYTKEAFHVFNQPTSVQQTPMESAIRISDTLSKEQRRTFYNSVAHLLGGKDTNERANLADAFIRFMITNGLITPSESPLYFDKNQLTLAGQSLLETVLLSTALDSNTIRTLNREGMGRIRARVISALPELGANAALPEAWSVRGLMNGAINLVYDSVRMDKGNVISHIAALDLFGEGVTQSLEEVLLASLLSISTNSNVSGIPFSKAIDKINKRAQGTDMFNPETNREQVLIELYAAKVGLKEDAESRDKSFSPLTIEQIKERLRKKDQAQRDTRDDVNKLDVSGRVGLYRMYRNSYNMSIGRAIAAAMMSHNLIANMAKRNNITIAEQYARFDFVTTAPKKVRGIKVLNQNRSFEEFIRPETLEENYGYETDLIADERFDISKLKKLGQGSDRVVYALGDGYVLKVAKTARGLWQNSFEGDGYFDPMAETVEAGEDYVIAKRYTPTNGKNLNDAQKAAVKDMKAWIKNAPFFGKNGDDLYNYIEERFPSFADFRPYIFGDVMRLSSWGMDEDGEFYLIDGGTLGSLQDYKAQQWMGDVKLKRRKAKKANTLFQRAAQGADPHAAITILQDGRFIVHALTNPNVSSPLHELAHAFETTLTNAERAAVLKFAGHATWTDSTSEIFARGYERYLYDGETGAALLKTVFKAFSTFLRNIYKDILRSPIKRSLSPEMRAIYADMSKGEMSLDQVFDELNLTNEERTAAEIETGIAPYIETRKEREEAQATQDEIDAITNPPAEEAPDATEEATTDESVNEPTVEVADDPITIEDSNGDAVSIDTSVITPVSTPISEESEANLLEYINKRNQQIAAQEAKIANALSEGLGENVMNDEQVSVIFQRLKDTGLRMVSMGLFNNIVEFYQGLPRITSLNSLEGVIDEGETMITVNRSKHGVQLGIEGIMNSGGYSQLKNVILRAKLAGWDGISDYDDDRDQFYYSSTLSGWFTKEGFYNDDIKQRVVAFAIEANEKFGGSRTVELGELMGVEFSALYPSLAKTPVLFSILASGGTASADGKVTVSLPLNRNGNEDYTNVAATFVHEVQHMVQYADGGATPTTTMRHAIRQLKVANEGMFFRMMAKVAAQIETSSPTLRVLIENRIKTDSVSFDEENLIPLGTELTPEEEAMLASAEQFFVEYYQSLHDLTVELYPVEHHSKGLSHLAQASAPIYIIEEGERQAKFAQEAVSLDVNSDSINRAIHVISINMNGIFYKSVVKSSIEPIRAVRQEIVRNLGTKSSFFDVVANELVSLKSDRASNALEEALNEYAAQTIREKAAQHELDMPAIKSGQAEAIKTNEAAYRFIKAFERVADINPKAPLDISLSDFFMIAKGETSYRYAAFNKLKGVLKTLSDEQQQALRTIVDEANNTLFSGFGYTINERNIDDAFDSFFRDMDFSQKIEKLNSDPNMRALLINLGLVILDKKNTEQIRLLAHAMRMSNMSAVGTLSESQLNADPIFNSYVLEQMALEADALEEISNRNIEITPPSSKLSTFWEWTPVFKDKLKDQWTSRFAIAKSAVSAYNKMRLAGKQSEIPFEESPDTMMKLEQGRVNFKTSALSNWFSGTTRSAITLGDNAAGSWVGRVTAILGNFEDASLYAYARHAASRNARIAVKAEEALIEKVVALNTRKNDLIATLQQTGNDPAYVAQVVAAVSSINDELTALRDSVNKADVVRDIIRDRDNAALAYHDARRNGDKKAMEDAKEEYDLAADLLRVQLAQEGLQYTIIAGSGMSDEMASKVIEDTKERIGEEKFKQLNELMEEFYENTTRMKVNELLAAGIITQERADAMLNGKTVVNITAEGEVELDPEGNGEGLPALEHYVPLSVLDESYAGIQDFGSSSSEASPSIMSLVGTSQYGSLERQSPLLNAVAQMNSTIKFIERNKVKRSFAAMVGATTSSWRIFRRMQDFFAPVTTNHPNFETSTFGSNVIRDNSITYYDNGVPMALFIPPIRREDGIFIPNPLVTEFKAKPYQEDNFVLGELAKIVMGYANWLRFISTTVNPDFVFTNPQRDIQDAMANLSSVYGIKNIVAMRLKLARNILPAANVIRAHSAMNQENYDKRIAALTAKYNNDPATLSHTERMEYYFHESKEAGVPMSWATDGSRKDYMLGLQEATERFKDGKYEKNRKDRVKKGIEVLSFCSEVTENMTRLATYAAMRDSGMTKERAAVIAKEISINFEDGGRMTKKLNVGWVFLNASVLGVSRALEALTTPRGAKWAAGMVGFGFSIAYLRHLVSGDDDDKSIYDRYKYKNKILIPNPMNPKDPFTISRSLSIFGVFELLGETAFEMTVTKDISPVEAASMMAEKTSAALNPTPLSYKTFKNPATGAPSIVQPIFAVATNKKFTDQEITPNLDFMKKYALYDQHSKNVGEPFLSLSEELFENTPIALRPAEIQYLTEQYSGAGINALRKILVKGTYATLRAMKDEEALETLAEYVEEPTFSQMPLVRSINPRSSDAPFVSFQSVSALVDRVKGKEFLTERELEFIRSVMKDKEVTKDVAPIVLKGIKKDLAVIEVIHRMKRNGASDDKLDKEFNKLFKQRKDDK